MMDQTSDQDEEDMIAETEALFTAERQAVREDMRKTNPVVASLYDAADALQVARSLIAHQPHDARQAAMLAAMDPIENALYDGIETIEQEQGRLTLEQWNELPEDFREFVPTEGRPHELSDV